MGSIRETFQNMPAAFQKDAAKGFSGVYQFELSGEGGGTWHAAITNGELQVAEGAHAAPDVVISAKAEHYLAIAEGRMNQMLAFATGKLKVRGDLGKAMKLQSLFKR
jgi:putative sterol carrier protein